VVEDVGHDRQVDARDDRGAEAAGAPSPAPRGSSTAAATSISASPSRPSRRCRSRPGPRIGFPTGSRRCRSPSQARGLARSRECPSGRPSSSRSPTTAPVWSAGSASPRARPSRVCSRTP
jgi:hypothetical protein